MTTIQRKPDLLAAQHRLRTHRRLEPSRGSRLYLGAAIARGVRALDHINEYYTNDFRTVPTIGVLFLLNFVTAVVLAVGLVAPIGPRRPGAMRTPSVPSWPLPGSG